MLSVRVAAVTVLTFALAGCGGSDEPEQPEEPGLFDQARQMGQAAQGLQRMGETMEEESKRPPAEPVDFRRLKEMLPETAAGLPRTNAEGARQGMGGMDVSNATGTYSDGADASVTLTVSDMGGIQGAAMMGAMWTMVTIDRETDTETERTHEIGGFPGYEKYNSERQAGEMQVVVANRFLVKAEGRGVSADQLKSAFETIDLRTLDGMKDEGRPAE